jgi:DMSO/TMAO reductase YedYZ molybdopterin-dependent catalytic subunit
MKNRLLVSLAILSLAIPFILTACSGGTVTSTSTTASTSSTSTTNTTSTTSTVTTTDSTSTTNPNGEIEAVEFMGTALTPISKQWSNALAGTQKIDRETYALVIDGLVDHPITLTYDDLLALPQQERLQDLDCVEGWSFTAKWTGPSLSDILKSAGIKPEAKIVIFDTMDAAGYTSLDLAFILDNDIILGLKDNDITLTETRGFPFQVVAMQKWGYKWAKWVIRIELSDNTSFRGYWETVGYSNNAAVGSPAFD